MRYFGNERRATEEKYNEKEDKYIWKTGRIKEVTGRIGGWRYTEDKQREDAFQHGKSYLCKIETLIEASCKGCL